MFQFAVAVIAILLTCLAGLKMEFSGTQTVSISALQRQHLIDSLSKVLLSKKDTVRINVQHQVVHYIDKPVYIEVPMADNDSTFEIDSLALVDDLPNSDFRIFRDTFSWKRDNAMVKLFSYVGISNDSVWVRPNIEIEVETQKVDSLGIAELLAVKCPERVSLFDKFLKWIGLRR